MDRNLFFELLDIAYFSRPHILAIDVVATAAELRRAKAGGAFMSYDPAFDQIRWILAGATWQHVEAAIQSQQVRHEAHVLAVAKCLYEIFHGRRGRWHPAKRKPIQIWSGAFLKGCARGVYVTNNLATACVFNPRKAPQFSKADIQFIARGAYEMHVRDDLNVRSFSIYDASAPHLTLTPTEETGAQESAVRKLKEYHMDDIEPISIEQFEAVCDRFFQAARVAGFTRAEAPVGTISDLFRSVVR